LGALIVICSLVLATAVVMLITGPLRHAQLRQPGATAADEAAELAGEEHEDELEAAREAKYREIRDAELDYRTGKLSAVDYQAIDDQLRAEALQILDRLQALPGAAGEQPETAPAAEQSDGDLSY
jgi:hypothetical protein